MVSCINSRLRLVQDSRLSNPTSSKPAFRFGTIPNGATDFIMLKVSCDWWIYLHAVSILVSDWLQNFPTMHAYMRRYNERTVKAGLGAVKQGKLDAFIYDATVRKPVHHISILDPRYLNINNKIFIYYYFCIKYFLGAGVPGGAG